MSFYNSYMQTELADLPKILSKSLFEKFILNFFASIHPDFQQLYSDDAKLFMRDTFFRIRNISMKHNKVNIWSGRQLLEHCVEGNMTHTLLFVPISKDLFDIVRPTFWFHKQIVDEILYKFS